MKSKNTPKAKLILFSLITTLVFFSILEISARVLLSLKMHSFQFMAYGLRDMRREKFVIVKGQDGEMLYCKGIPSKDKINPVNSRGFRGPEIHEKRPGTIRVVCLGGSVTYGAGLDYQDTYPAILQKKLDEKFGRYRYEVINGGQPGADLPQIISLTKNDVIPLKPDIIILMNINNNLKAPGFWFIDIQGADRGKQSIDQKQEVSTKYPIVKVREFIVAHLALAHLIHEAVPSGVVRYFINFDWKAFSRALMAPDNIWQAEFRENLHREVRVLSKNDPKIKIILLEEAVNTIKYPELEDPFGKAREIMGETSKAYRNVYTLDIQSAIITAVKNGERIWQTPSYDPLHLVREGNEVIADVLYILA